MLDALLGWMSWIELVATIFGVVNVWLTVRQNIWCWPTGLVMVALYIHIFYQARLYSDMGLQVVYIFMQLYGWYYWLRGPGAKGETQELPVSRLGPKNLAIAAAIALGCTGALGFIMDTYTDADLAYWDGATTILSLIAQWFLARKILESWAFWITVDVMAIGIYAAKGLYLTSGLYVIFLGLAISGFIQWLKTYRRDQLQRAPAAA